LLNGTHKLYSFLERRAMKNRPITFHKEYADGRLTRFTFIPKLSLFQLLRKAVCRARKKPYRHPGATHLFITGPADLVILSGPRAHLMQSYPGSRGRGNSRRIRTAQKDFRSRVIKSGLKELLQAILFKNRKGEELKRLLVLALSLFILAIFLGSMIAHCEPDGSEDIQETTIYQVESGKQIFNGKVIDPEIMRVMLCTGNTGMTPIECMGFHGYEYDSIIRIDTMPNNTYEVVYKHEEAPVCQDSGSE